MTHFNEDNTHGFTAQQLVWANEQADLLDLDLVEDSDEYKHQCERILKEAESITVIVSETDGPFSGPVSRDENPAAHGNICRTQVRDDGMTRRININGDHREVGPWV